MNIFDIFERLKRERKDKDEKIGAIEYLIVGLGNPGSQYENTRHNAGFMAVDALAKKLGVTIKKLKFKSLTGQCVIGNKRCLLMKPSTFMNLSGQAVTEAMQFYKIKMQNIIVIFDDAALPAGKIRIRRKGSDGGQNGVKNIIYLSGNDEFPRIKIGIGSPPHKDYNLADWVLSHMSDEEMGNFNRTIEKLDAIIELIVTDKINQAMNEYN